MKHEWSLMSWLEIRDAVKQNPVVLLPIGCVETHGPHTPVGIEAIAAQRYANDLAERTDSLALPVLPYGNSMTFKTVPGTIYIRPEILTEIYEDAILSILRAGFTHVFCIAYHKPNDPPLDTAARRVREKTGISIAWVNPSLYGSPTAQEVFAPEARGHGAESALSLARYLVGTEIPENASTGEQPGRYGAFDVKGARLAYDDLPIGMPIRWEELYPETGGFGNTNLGSAEAGRKVYEGALERLAGAIEAFKTMDVRNPLKHPNPAG